LLWALFSLVAYGVLSYEYVREALDALEVSRIDHGVRCEEDPADLIRILSPH
jgi:adenosine deaminase